MNAVILAGGFGSRLKPLTDYVPKPMLPVANAPILDYAVAHLRHFGITDIVFTLGYLPQQVIDWIGGYGGINTEYIIEDIPLGTAGGVCRAREYLDDCFIVVSGDALENIDYAAMYASHVKSGKLITMAVTSVPDPRKFGLVEYDGYGCVTAFKEKPSEYSGDGVVNCGVYIINKQALKFVPYGSNYDFARDLFPVLLKEKSLNAYYHNGYWCDVGSPQAYYDANFKMTGCEFYPFAVNKYRCSSRRIGANKKNYAAYSAIVTGRCNECIIGEGSAVASNADLHECIVLPKVTVSGYHYREIIGDGYGLTLAPEFDQKLHDSTGIYKNFL